MWVYEVEIGRTSMKGIPVVLSNLSCTFGTTLLK